MNKPMTALIIATLTCGTASAYLWQELRVERAQTRSLQTRVAELETQSAQEALEPPPIEQPARTPDPAPAEPAVAAAPEKSLRTAQAATFAVAPTGSAMSFVGPGAGGPVDPNVRRRMQEGFEQQQRMLKDPEYRELMRSQQKMGLKRMYGDMETMLGLSKEESDHVLDVLAEQQLRGMEQRPLGALWGESPPDAAALQEQRRVHEELQRRNDAELARALGPKYSEWQEYQQNTWSRSQVMRLRDTLSGSNEPLRQDQIKPLVEALAREQQQMQMNTVRTQQIPPGGRMNADSQLRMQEEWLERTAQSHERIRASVSSLLSPSQLQQLQEQQDHERKMQELNLRMQRARAAEAQARGEDPAAEAMLGVSAVPAIR